MWLFECLYTFQHFFVSCPFPRSYSYPLQDTCSGTRLFSCMFCEHGFPNLNFSPFLFCQFYTSSILTNLMFIFELFNIHNSSKLKILKMFCKISKVFITFVLSFRSLMYLKWVCFHVGHKIFFKFWCIFPLNEWVFILEPFTKRPYLAWNSM